MTVVLIVAGAGLIATAVVDLAWTTMAAGSGAGPLTRRAAGRLWHLAMAASRRTNREAILTASAVIIVFAVLALWIALVYTGWALIFSASDGAVRSTPTGEVADLGDRLYFTGYTIFTLGNGEFRPGRGTWQAVTVLASGTGLILVTLSITYLVPVASAVAQRRQVASLIASLGSSPHEILTRSWRGDGFGALTQQLATITPLLQAGRQMHYTYPVLHYFHSMDRPSAAPPNVVNLNDALLLLEHGVPPEVRPDGGVRRALDDTIGAFLDTLRAAHITPTDEPLAPPSLEPLRRAGIPVVDEAVFGAAVAATRNRRRLLAGLLEDDAWAGRGHAE